MDEEMSSLEKNETWELVDLPEGRRPIGSKWTYKIKRDAHGTITKYKARLVAQGYSQVQGIDYEEVYAPVTKQTTMRAFLAKAGKHKMKVFHYDAASAFLNGELEEEIYMLQPQGYIIEGQEAKVCKLRRSIYGLKQSARAWYKKMDSILTKQGFRRSESDPCLYTRDVGGTWIGMVLYVDDTAIASINETLILRTGEQIGTEVEFNCMGEIQLYLGLHIDKDATDISE